MTNKPLDHATELHRAAAVGDMEALAAWLRCGRAVDPRDAEGNTPFHLACKQVEPGPFRALIAAGAEVDAVNGCQMSGLFLVATVGNVSLGRELLRRGADVNRTAARGLTPLIAAVMSDNAAMVELLLAAGANPRYRDGNGTAVLKWAQSLGGAEVVQLIRNFDPARPPEPRPPTVADLATGATTGDVERIHECLNAGLAVDSTNGEGWTPLMLAARQGRRAAIEALLAAGADPYRCTPSGTTAMILAANDSTALRPFHAAGVDLNWAPPTTGHTPLIFAARQGFLDVVAFLLSAGVDPLVTDRAGHTALDHATANGHRRIVHALRSVMEPALV